VALAVALLCIVALPFALRIPIDNRVERFLDSAGEAALRYESFRQAFGNDQYILAAYRTEDLFAEDALDLQLDVLERIEQIPHVGSVRAIPQVYRDLFGAEDAEALRQEFLSTPFYRGHQISDDGLVGCYLIEVEIRDGDVDLNLLVDGIDEALLPLRNRDWDVYMVGHPVLHVKMEEVTNREAVKTFPIALVFSVVVLMLLFRSVKATLVCLLCMTVTVLLTIGFMGWVGVGLSMVTSSLPMVLWVLALANLIHILRRYEEDRSNGASIESDIASALRQTALPCAIAMVTTAVGFLSLLAATMQPIRELGLFAAIGLIISLVVSLSLGPFLVEKLRVPGLGSRVEKQRIWILAVIRFSLKYRRVTCLMTLLFFILSLSLLPRIVLESNVLTFLPDDSDTVRAFSFVSEHLTGLYSLEAMVRVPQGWLDETTWTVLEGLQDQFQLLGEKGLGDLSAVATVISPLNLLKKLNQWDFGSDPLAYRLPETEDDAKRLLNLLDEDGLREVGRLVSEDGKLLRFSILIRDTDSARFLNVARQAQALLNGLPSPMSGSATGIVLQMAEMQISLVETQARSLVLAFLSVFLCILIGLRSWRLTLVSVLPNLLPILCTFGVMSLCGITLNPATVMVASISLGIAVDDAVHVLNAYQQFRAHNMSPKDAVREALLKVAPAITMTTVTACIGFFAMSRSAFAPVRYFGMLAGTSMILALAGNLFLVPAILTMGRDSSRKR